MTFDDRINAVPWNTLHHAYGPAEDVPDLLVALMSPERAKAELRAAAEKNQRSLFDHVTWTLWGNVIHQGSVWQATAATVPFFVEILRDGPDISELKTFLITYLHSLATGYSDDIFPEVTNPDVEFAEIVGVEEPGGEPAYDGNRPLIWMRDSYEAVERHLGELVAYVDAGDKAVAEAAIALCASFPRRVETTAPALRTLAAHANRRGATAAISLAALRDPECVALARAMIAAAPDPVTTVLAACAIAIFDAKQVTPEDAVILTAPMGDIADTELVHTANLRGMVGQCLVRLGPDYRARAVHQICAQMAGATPMTSITLTQSLLQIAFPDFSVPDRPSDLSAPQRQALEAIRDHGAFEVAGGVFANYCNTLQAWGLPLSAAELRRWLRKGRWFF